MPLIASSQTYQIEKGKLEKLLQAYFYTLPACDSTVTAYQIALQKADSLLHQSEKLILIRTQERDLKVMESETWEKRFNNQDQIHKEEIKTARKKAFKLGSTTTGLVAILVIVLL